MSTSTAKRIRKAFPTTEIHHVYGLTEACPRVSHLPPELFDRYPDCAGIPLNSVKIKITDEDNNEVVTGETGTLWIQGKNVMHGYYKKNRLTKKVLQNGWLCTGDTARITEDGLLQIKGRKDDLIIRAGMNIYPQEIEAEIKKDPRTKEVLVQGIPAAVGGTQIAMKIAGDFKDVHEIRDLCAKVLPSYQIPNKIELVDSIPKNGTGKIIREKKHDRI